MMSSRTYKCSMQVWQATMAGSDILLALCRDFTVAWCSRKRFRAEVKKFAAASGQLLQTIKITPTDKDAGIQLQLNIIKPL